MSQAWLSQPSPLLGVVLTILRKLRDSLSQDNTKATAAKLAARKSRLSKAEAKAEAKQAQDNEVLNDNDVDGDQDTIEIFDVDEDTITIIDD